MLAKKITHSLTRFWDEEDGASAIEYGLFASLIAAAIAVTVGTLGTTVDGKLSYVEEQISGE